MKYLSWYYTLNFKTLKLLSTQAKKIVTKTRLTAINLSFFQNKLEFK